MIKLEKANFSFNKYNKKVIIVKDFDFVSDNNERLYLKGDNGSGKTSLLRVLAGFYKLDSGNYQCDSKIGFIPTKLDYFLLPWYSVMQNLNFFNKNLDINSELYKDKYIDLIHLFFEDEDDKFLLKRVYELSSGQKAVLSFICSQLTPSDIYLFDELFANVSMSMSRKLVDYIKTRNMHIIFTAHCEEIGKQLCTKTLQIEDYQ